MRILGIDPSVQSTGFGIIEFRNNAYSAITYGVIRPSSKLPFHQKIHRIKILIEELIDNHKPEDVAIENPFYAKNIKTALSLGQVRGATLVAVAEHHCHLFEYSALEIKKAVTGYGRADKHQVLEMIKQILNIQDDRMGSDAADALAAAVCHIHTKLFHSKIEMSETENK